jgi:hypothetical protein
VEVLELVLPREPEVLEAGAVFEPVEVLELPSPHPAIEILKIVKSKQVRSFFMIRNI